MAPTVQMPVARPSAGSRAACPCGCRRRARLILAAAASHIMPGPLRGYWNDVDQRLDHLAALLRRGRARQRVAQRVRHGAPQIEALDALRRPVGRDLVAAHAPHLLGVGLEEDRRTGARRTGWRPSPGSSRGSAVGNACLCRNDSTHSADLDDAEVVQRLEGLERIGEELAVVVDARQARALDEVVGQDLRPEVVDLLRLGEEAVAADVELEVLVAGGAADAADVGADRPRAPWWRRRCLVSR